KYLLQKYFKKTAFTNFLNIWVLLVPLLKMVHRKLGMVHKKRKLAERLKDKYKLVILNNETFEEKASVILNGITVMLAASMIAIVLILLTSALLIFTPMREYIPGYADLSLRKEITETAYKADSLEAILMAQQAYIGNIHNIINGTAGD